MKFALICSWAGPWVSGADTPAQLLSRLGPVSLLKTKLKYVVWALACRGTSEGHQRGLSRHTAQGLLRPVRMLSTSSPTTAPCCPCPHSVHSWIRVQQGIERRQVEEDHSTKMCWKLQKNRLFPTTNQQCSLVSVRESLSLAQS